MQIVVNWLSKLRIVGQKAGPYLVLEMLMPGGTLFVLLLLLYRRRISGIGARSIEVVPVREMSVRRLGQYIVGTFKITATNLSSHPTPDRLVGRARAWPNPT